MSSIFKIVLGVKHVKRLKRKKQQWFVDLVPNAGLAVISTECISILVIQTILVTLRCWRAVISRNDATGPECFWLHILDFQINLSFSTKKLRSAYSKKTPLILVFGCHLSMRRPSSARGHVLAYVCVCFINQKAESIARVR